MAKRIRTINTESLQKTAKTGGCGECQTSCQSRLQNKLHCRQPGLQTEIRFFICFDTSMTQ